jgi:hypothetical protein
MKTLPKVSFLAILLIATCLRGQVTLFDFSATTGSNTFFYGTWQATGLAGDPAPNASFTQGSGVYNILGTAKDDTNSILEYFYTPTPANITGNSTFLSMTFETLNTNTASSFTVTLFDTNAKSAYATFLLGSYTGVYTTQSSALTAQGGFLFNSIDSFQISGNQVGGTATLNVSFDNLSATSAVPEPATYAAIFGLFAFGMVALRRRMTAL